MNKWLEKKLFAPIFPLFASMVTLESFYMRVCSHIGKTCCVSEEKIGQEVLTPHNKLGRESLFEIIVPEGGSQDDEDVDEHDAGGVGVEAPRAACEGDQKVANWLKLLDDQVL